MWYVGIILYVIGLYGAGMINWWAFLFSVCASLGAVLFTRST